MLRRILFIGEGVSLAHVGRPLVLAESLLGSSAETFMATSARYRRFVNPKVASWRELPSLEPEEFNRRLGAGESLMRPAELRQRIADDLELLDEVQPDLVVGDFRLSLQVSCRVAGIPYANVTNAHWSPNYDIPTPMPELPVLSRMGNHPWTRGLFRLICPITMRLHARTFATVRHEYGLPALPGLRDYYLDADWVLFADSPTLTPLSHVPDGQIYLGPLAWSPEIQLPTWWHSLPSDRPLVYVTMGSSGDTGVLHSLLAALSSLPVNVALATAGRVDTGVLPANIYAAPYLPGTACLRRAALAVTNGGLSTAQALLAGVPVLAIPCNMDQHLATIGLLRAGAGRMIRAGEVTTKRAHREFGCLLEQPGFATAAKKIARELRPDVGARFQEFLAQIALVEQRRVA